MMTPINFPIGIVYLNWDFGTPISEFTIDFEVVGVKDVLSKHGIYFQLYDGKSGLFDQYGGVQTKILNGNGDVKPGVLHTRWGSAEESHAKPDPAGGWIALRGDKEENTGVRRHIEWLGRRIVASLSRHTPAESDSKGSWWSWKLSSCGNELNNQTAGSLLYGQDHTLLNDGGGTWIELYGDTISWEDLPEFEFIVHRVSANDGRTFPRKVTATFNKNALCSTSIINQKSSIHVHISAGRSSAGNNFKFDYPHAMRL